MSADLSNHPDAFARIEFIHEPGWYVRCAFCKWTSIAYPTSREANVRMLEHNRAEHPRERRCWRCKRAMHPDDGARCLRCEKREDER